MRNAIKLGWPVFKAQVLDLGSYSWIYFDVDDHYLIYAKQNDFTVLCKIFKEEGSADKLDFEENYKPNCKPVLKSRVVTAEEENDKRLKLASAEAEFDAETDIAEVSIRVPAGGRWIAGGYAFTDSFKRGDRVTKVQLVDVDNILGAGEHFVVATFHDVDVDEPNQGWRMWPAPNGSSECEIDPIGGYGFLPEGLYLEIYIKRGAGSAATFAAVDYWWAKNE